MFFCNLFYRQALDLVKQAKVAQILGDEKGSTRRGSRSSLANSEHEQHDEVSQRCVYYTLNILFAPHAVAHH